MKLTIVRRIRDRQRAARLVLALALLLPTASVAQQPLTNPLGGFATNSKAPIDIKADSLVINDAKKVAIYRGNVVAIQGDVTLRTVELEVHYATKGAEKSKNDAAPAGGGDMQQIKRILAKKQVVLTSTKDQTATGDLAEYEVGAQTVVMSGGVILKQGPNILKGDRLIVDLKSGESRMEGGRVSTVLHPQQGAGGAAASDPKSKPKK
jgi:lipopolysaccharide export system protein LptA